MSAKNIKCSSCGAINNNIVKFCTSCGNKMITPPITTSVSVTSSPTSTSKSFSSPSTQPILAAKTITTTTVTTTSSTRPASTIIKPTTTTTTTTSTRPASTIIKPTTTTTTTTTTPKSILKPTPPVPSHTTTTTSTIPSKSILKPVSTTPAPVITRPKSHTISSKPTTVPSSSSNGNLSFVKMAAMNRESLDNKARESMNIGQSPVMSPAPIISTPSPSKSTLNIKKTTTTTTTTTTPQTTTRPASMSVSIPSKQPVVDKTKDIDKLEKQIQIEKEKFQNKEREIAQQRQQQYERDKQAEREKHMTEKQQQAEKEEREKQKQLEREREKQEEIKKQQLDREREKHEHIEREKQKLLDREKQKQLEKEEKEKQHQEREKQKQLEKEREREKQAEKDEKERLKRLERERHNSSSPITISSPSPNRKDSNPTPSSPSLPSTLNNSRDESSNDHHHHHHDNESTIESSSPNNASGKKKRDKEKSKSRIFSLFSSKKDEDDEDELTISGPTGNSNGHTPSPTPMDSPSNNINHHHSSSSLSHSSDCGGSDRDSGDFSSSNNGEGQLRKWAIKRNELHKSEGNLFAPSSPSAAISGSSNSSFTPIGSHSPTGSSESLKNTPGSPSSSFIPSHSPSTSNTSTFQMGTSRISSPNPPPDLPSNLPQAVEQRDRVIEEVIVTEADYIRDLEIMVWLKKEMIIHDNDVKGNTIEEINSLFSNVEQLLLVNKELYKKFCNFDNSFNPIDNNADYIDLIANGFSSMAEFLRSYFVYCSNQQKALSTFSELKGKNCTYLAYLLTRRECRSLPFDSFLIKPVQRVCKYPLLIRELIKTTPTDSESYGNLLNAQSKIESIVFSVNEKKREFDSQMKMLSIQNRIIESGDNTTKILSPSRKLIKEGTIISWGSTVPNGVSSFVFKKKNKEGYFYLFNDLFIYAELKITGSLSMGASTSPIRVKSEIPFEYSVICDSPLDECSFELKNKNQWCMFSLDTLEEKTKLFTEIDNSIQSYQGILYEYQKYVDDRNGGSNRQSVNGGNSQPSAATITNGTTNSLSLSSSSIGGGGASSSSSSEVLSIEEWKILVKNKPLPALPSHSTISNSPVGSPSSLRIGKALPTPPPPSK